MSTTDDLLRELDRTKSKLALYKASIESPTYPWTYHAEHAAAKRATMDLTKLLAKWRQMPKPHRGVK